MQFQIKDFLLKFLGWVLETDKQKQNIALISLLLRKFVRTIEKQPPFFWKAGLIPAPQGHHSSWPVCDPGATQEVMAPMRF